jgi:hypothetical protein
VKGVSDTVLTLMAAEGGNYMIEWQGLERAMRSAMEIFGKKE